MSFTDNSPPPLNDPLSVRFGLSGGNIPQLPPLTETDIRVLQQVLQASGFNPGAIDGRWGPRTSAALQAFQQANGWEPTGQYDDITRHRVGDVLTWVASERRGGAQGPLQPIQASEPPLPQATFDAGGGAGGGGGGAAAANPIIERLKAQGLVGDELFLKAAESLFPQLAGLTGIDELRPLFIQAAREEWTEGEIQNRFESTEWWRSTPQRARAWIMLQSTDPASAQRRLEESKREFESLAQQYLQPMSDKALTDWTRQILSGQVPEDAFRGHLIEQAKSRWDHLSGALDKGVTVVQYADAYAQDAAQLLEINPEAINFMDPKWGAALDFADPETGQRRAMTRSEWINKIRSDDQYGWDRTTGARTQGAQFAQELARTFGKVA